MGSGPRGASRYPWLTAKGTWRAREKKKTSLGEPTVASGSTTTVLLIHAPTVPILRSPPAPHPGMPLSTFRSLRHGQISLCPWPRHPLERWGRVSLTKGEKLTGIPSMARGRIARAVVTRSKLPR